MEPSQYLAMAVILILAVFAALMIGALTREHRVGTDAIEEITPATALWKEGAMPKAPE